MRKLTLNLDALKVEQFEVVARGADARGTVVGADAFMTGPDNCVTISCGDSVHQSCELY
ncbi:MAG TPA: hypothetical protein VF006_20560 [Longimicrobium sp.]